jgi:hypothetical protein
MIYGGRLAFFDAAQHLRVGVLGVLPSKVRVGGCLAGVAGEYLGGPGVTR